MSLTAPAFPLPKNSTWVVDDATGYRTENKVYPEYIFPFTLMDPTPGGQNLGRMEWQLEPLPSAKQKGRRYIQGLAIWARQTRDPRYTSRIFLIPTRSEAITGSRRLLGERTEADFVSGVWHMGFCELHRSLILTAYPPDGMTRLIVRTGSSISNEVYFDAR